MKLIRVCSGKEVVIELPVGTNRCELVSKNRAIVSVKDNTLLLDSAWTQKNKPENHKTVMRVECLISGLKFCTIEIYRDPRS